MFIYLIQPSVKSIMHESLKPLYVLVYITSSNSRLSCRLWWLFQYLKE